VLGGRAGRPHLSSRAHACTAHGAPSSRPTGASAAIAKTVEFKGYRFDLGGHRFFTKLKPIERLWESIMGEEMLVRPAYVAHLLPGQVLLVPADLEGTSSRASVSSSLLSGALLVPGGTAQAPEGSGYLRGMGSRCASVAGLYDAFFRSYTEKVWGIPGSEIRSQWAAQRIKDFSLVKAVPLDPGNPPERRDDADRGVQVSAARPGPDVGTIPGAGSRSTGSPFISTTAAFASSTATGGSRTITVRHNGSVDEHAVDKRDLDPRPSRI